MNIRTILVMALAVSVAAVACAGNGGSAAGSIDADLGLIPIGGVPRDMRVFVASDCESLPDGLADCSAQDADGRQYAFFDGALSKVSVSDSDAVKSLRLPVGLIFKEDINHSAKKVADKLGVKLDRATNHDGRTTYSSDFSIRSSAGVLYSIELIADAQGRLVEVVERTDF